MDSLTQLTFGAALGEAVLGHRVGRKALAWGAFLGTLPDLDVLIPMGGPVDDFVYHRGFSHSLFLLGVLAPLIGWLITKVHPKTKEHLKGWMVMSFLVLELSVLLDYFTIYGTQILWPISKTPLAWSVFFIIDPLLTLPILVGALAALVLSRSSGLGHRINTIGITLCFMYMAWAFGARVYVDHKVEDLLEKQGVHYTQLTTTPAPFTTFLWRYLGMKEDSYFETYYSVFDGNTPLRMHEYPRNMKLLQGIETHPPVQKLVWFTRGYYALSLSGKDIILTDLRMGSEPDYVFSFKVAEAGNPHPKLVSGQQREAKRDWSQLNWVWNRIWSPQP